MTLLEVFRQLRNDPGEMLIRRWNWKSAIFSSAIRAGLFFLTNLAAGRRAAVGAMIAELAYRIPTGGFYGALTQAFRKVDPPWAAALGAMVLLPSLSHSIEFLVHFSRGTPHLGASIACSICFTALSTLFNLYAMRRGVLVVGSGSGSVIRDLCALPRTIVGFIAVAPIATYRMARPFFSASPLGSTALSRDDSV